jgi:lysozyme
VKTSKAMQQQIKKWESGSDIPQLKAYVCPSGKLTIGFGHTWNVKPGQTITAAQAEILFQKDLERFEKAVTNELKARVVPLTQNQFDALVSWTYNCGTGALKTTNALKWLLKGKDAQAWLFLEQWNKDDKGKPLKGLVTRRAMEQRWFEKGTFA